MRIALLRRIPDEIYKELLTALAKVGSHGRSAPNACFFT
jgi:hypothetical protein